MATLPRKRFRPSTISSAEKKKLPAIGKIPRNPEIPKEGSIADLLTQNDEVIYLNPHYFECPNSKLNSIDILKNLSTTIRWNPSGESYELISSLPLKQVQIYNIKGVLEQERLFDGDLQWILNTQGLSKGVYIVKSTIQNGELNIKKLIIK